MKMLMTTFSLVTAALATPAVSQAACIDRWGNQAYVQEVRNDVISMKFSTAAYPASGHLKYSGERTRSYYFRGNGNTVEMEKSVATSGRGRIWYHYFDRNEGNHGQTKMVSFSCR